jgi:hypothetical protein
MNRTKALTTAEKSTISTMCDIAAQHRKQTERGLTYVGTGDYELWTEADFERAAAIARKMVGIDE